MKCSEVAKALKGELRGRGFKFTDAEGRRLHVLNPANGRSVYADLQAGRASLDAFLALCREVERAITGKGDMCPP